MFMKKSTRRTRMRQDIIRSDILRLLRRVIVAEDSGEFAEKIEGCFSDGYVIALSYFKHRLDLHNKNVFDNLSKRVDMIKNKYNVEENLDKPDI